MRPTIKNTLELDAAELEQLRAHLVQLGPDYCGASEVIRAFLNGHGYGVSPESAQLAAVEFGRRGCSVDSIARALGAVTRAN